MRVSKAQDKLIYKMKRLLVQISPPDLFKESGGEPSNRDIWRWIRNLVESLREKTIENQNILGLVTTHENFISERAKVTQVHSSLPTSHEKDFTTGGTMRHPNLALYTSMEAPALPHQLQPTYLNT
jgi:hypothetical protein